MLFSSPRNLVAVVIPVYKSTMNADEEKSLNRCIKVLGKFPLILVCPQCLNLSNYELHIPHNTNFTIQRFPDKFFKDIQGYNNLLLSTAFYKRFNLYQYILIYQLDAWVFKNELEHWCQKGYDYIGAPWFKGFGKATENEFIGVGNGGFSLRKVKSHLRVLNSFKYVYSPNYYLQKFLNNRSWETFVTFVENITIKNNFFHALNSYDSNEDLFFGGGASKAFKWFNVPDLQTALKFAVEINPSHFITDAEHVPFGCHAWEKYEPEFWQDLMKTYE